MGSNSLYEDSILDYDSNIDEAALDFDNDDDDEGDDDQNLTSSDDQDYTSFRPSSLQNSPKLERYSSGELRQLENGRSSSKKHFKIPELDGSFNGNSYIPTRPSTYHSFDGSYNKHVNYVASLKTGLNSKPISDPFEDQQKLGYIGYDDYARVGESRNINGDGAEESQEEDDDDDDDDDDGDGDDDDDDDDDNDIYDDTYSFDFPSSTNTKPGDKIRTSISIQNERQYKDLQIIDEVSKLQNMKFFNNQYIKNLEDLKMAQLGLLIDMVKLTENSLDEFNEVWHSVSSNVNNDSKESKEMDTMKDISKNDISSSSNNVTSEGTSLLSSLSSLPEPSNQIVPDSQKKPNEVSGNSQAQVNLNLKNDSNEGFKINNSKSFKLMHEHKFKILEDLNKIKSSIDNIDDFTINLWKKSST